LVVSVFLSEWYWGFEVAYVAYSYIQAKEQCVLN
jgi:hypothetical protein